MLAVRAFLPEAKQVWLVDSAEHLRVPMRRLHPAGFFEALCSKKLASNRSRYRLRLTDRNGEMKTIDDPYSFPSFFTDYDLHLLGEGTHYRCFERLGAHRREVDGVEGVNFAVWAPNAQAVSVTGEFNDWDARRHQLRRQFDNGIWELFIPEARENQLYKYNVKTLDGQVVDKADPYGFAAEIPPKTASIVRNLDRYQWSDSEWMASRRGFDFRRRPVSIYEVHLGSWRRDGDRWLTYSELAVKLVEYCREMGFTHVELLPVSEHPFYGSWGYQPIGMFAATGRYGSTEELMSLVDHCHQHGIGVIIDWVPAHFPRDDHGLRRFDGTALYEHEDPRKGEHPDWGTLVFNYGRNEVRNYLVANALFWLDKYHIDGLRVDAVASMLYLDYSREDGQWEPNVYGGNQNLEAVAFIQQFNRTVHEQYPGVLTIAEESTAWDGVTRATDDRDGLGFNMKWNMGWMHDSLGFIRREPVHRRHHHNDLTFSIVYSFSESFVLALSHDEVVHGKGSLISPMPGDLWQKFANTRLLYSYMWTHPGKKLLFMGGEFGQWNEWNHDSQLQWDLLQWRSHAGLQKMLADLNGLYVREAALHQQDFRPEGFEWIDCDNADESVISYIRHGEDQEDLLVVCCNFTPVVRENFLIGVPKAGWYDEVFNSDSEHYGGSNVGNFPGRDAIPAEVAGREFALKVTLPPLATLIFKPSAQTGGS